MRLVGQVALVTGAQQGIGRAIAVALAQDGADVGVNYLDDRGAAERVAGEVRAAGRRAAVVQGDVSRTRDAEAMVDAVARELGAPGILVNNAGVFPRVEFLAMTEADWDHVLDVNLKGSFLCAQAVARRLVEVDAGVPSSTSPRSPCGARRSASTTRRARPGSWGSRAAWRWRSRPIASA